MASDRTSVSAFVHRMADGRFCVIAGDLVVTAWRRETAAEVAVELVAGGAQLDLPADVETRRASA